MREKKKLFRRLMALVLALVLLLPLAGPGVVTESSAVTQAEINALKDDYEYSLQLEALVNGEVYQSQSEIEQQEEEEAEKYSDLEDILPEEEEYLNGIGD